MNFKDRLKLGKAIKNDLGLEKTYLKGEDGSWNEMVQGAFVIGNVPEPIREENVPPEFIAEWNKRMAEGWDESKLGRSHASGKLETNTDTRPSTSCSTTLVNKTISNLEQQQHGAFSLPVKGLNRNVTHAKHQVETPLKTVREEKAASNQPPIPKLRIKKNNLSSSNSTNSNTSNLTQKQEKIKTTPNPEKSKTILNMHKSRCAELDSGRHKLLAEIYHTTREIFKRRKHLDKQTIKPKLEIDGRMEHKPIKDGILMRGNLIVKIEELASSGTKLTDPPILNQVKFLTATNSRKACSDGILRLKRTQ